jgi:hypothetical protein
MPASHFFVRLVNACLCARLAGCLGRFDRPDEYHRIREKTALNRVSQLRFGTTPADSHDGFLRIARVGTRYNPRMAGAPSPERPVVLRRLGIIKDPNDPFLQESRAQQETAEDALELFATEAESSPRLERWLNAIRPHAAWSIRFVRRNPIIGVIVVSAVSLVVALWAIDRFVGSDVPPAQDEAALAATADTSAAPATDAPATKPANRSPRAPAANVNVSRTGNGTIARAQPLRNRPENVPVGSARLAVSPPQADQPDGRAPVAAASAPAAAPPSAEATVVDQTIYSAEDRDVVPPQTSEQLPGPTFSAWTTRTNAMEVIVSETGAVERVRLVNPPQRMPDVLVLSRAKVWKFKPAMKDGRPVRYRLLLKWEVNP